MLTTTKCFSTFLDYILNINKTDNILTLIRTTVTVILPARRTTENRFSNLLHRYIIFS